MTNILLLILRRDLRVSDNPALHRLSSSSSHGFTNLLPVYPFSPNQIEVSGFIKDGTKSPYPEARSQTGNYWRCGPHRAKFLAESVWNVKETLETLESGLVIRVGKPHEVIETLVDGLKAQNHKVGAVWMVSHEGTEEKRDEKDVAIFCKAQGVEFELLTDEKYFIDDRDISPENQKDLPDIYTTYRKSVEPLREKPRAVLPIPAKGTLPAFLENIPPQKAPFEIPDRLEELVGALVSPVRHFLPSMPAFPEGADSAHPFKGGETSAQERLVHLIQSEGMKNYKTTRNGLIGTEFSTKLSAYLAQGCVTARQIHHALLEYENGTDDRFKDVDGYGEGQNDGTAAIRFELLWRDYMRLCHQKFKHRLFRLAGFKGEEDGGYKDDEKKPKWKTPVKKDAPEDQDPTPERVREIIDRFNAGTTGMGLIDASQRELLHTGYTSNRARQNVASFLAKHLGIDWRYGAEWYEMLLVDYDVSSNWANWQYVAGVGNDPRGEARIFNPIKQAFDYDKEGKYVRSWVPEVSKVEKLENVFQACTLSEDDAKAAGLEGNIMITDPVKRIEFSVEGKPARPNSRAFYRRRHRDPKSSQEDGGASVDGKPKPAPAAIVSSTASSIINTGSESSEKQTGHRRGGSEGYGGRGRGRGVGGGTRGYQRGSGSARGSTRGRGMGGPGITVHTPVHVHAPQEGGTVAFSHRGTHSVRGRGRGDYGSLPHQTPGHGHGRLSQGSRGGYGGRGRGGYGGYTPADQGAAYVHNVVAQREQAVIPPPQTGA
ncbi:putative cryptochrome DASH, mitochondrial [Rhypophila decipiens]|uniref:Cryptochrome DASH n=1 Tax=Rhypophila decipiens TaxID=261697 RepID=A0AAN6YJ29_9PEZI|nr:putative cryptochrome DASH, mitochondrial [Rhypophila decipiens]